MTHIPIRELSAHGVIGLRPDGRESKQEVVVSLTLSTDLSRVGKSDVLEDCVHYRAIKKRVLAFIKESHFHLLAALAVTCLEAVGYTKCKSS